MSGLFLVLGLLSATSGNVGALLNETSAEKAEHLKQQANPGLFKTWNFDKDHAGELPAGFSVAAAAARPGATWKVQTQGTAPSSPHVLSGTSNCSSCMELLVADGLQYEYPDLAVRIYAEGAASPGRVGVAFGMKDSNNFYATVVDLAGKSLEVVRVVEGKESVLGRASLKTKPVDWHSLRVQRNTIISKDFIETFFDGQLAVSVEDQELGTGLVGLVLRGESSVQFDNFNAAPLYSHRPLSPPAAY
jgi:hypothetical protein